MRFEGSWLEAAGVRAARVRANAKGLNNARLTAGRKGEHKGGKINIILKNNF